MDPCGGTRRQLSHGHETCKKVTRRSSSADIDVARVPVRQRVLPQTRNFSQDLTAERHEGAENASVIRSLLREHPPSIRANSSQPSSAIPSAFSAVKSRISTT